MNNRNAWLASLVAGTTVFWKDPEGSSSGIWTVQNLGATEDVPLDPETIITLTNDAWGIAEVLPHEIFPVRILATFRPEAEMRGYITAVDAVGPDMWDVTEEAGINWSTLEHEERDQLREVPQAPYWVRNWQGPFEVELSVHQELEADQLLATRGTVKETPSDLPDLSIDIPDSEGSFGRGYRNALESMRLALLNMGVPLKSIKDATFTALEAYGNNADSVTKEELHEVLVASTAHATKDERQALLEGDLSPGDATNTWVSLTADDMSMLRVPSRKDSTPVRESLACLQPQLSNGLYQAVAKAVDLGASYLLLDMDASPLEGVEINE